MNIGLWLSLLVSLVGCARPPAPAVGGDDAELGAIVALHGGAGQRVVAGYRMGRFALCDAEIFVVATP